MLSLTLLPSISPIADTRPRTLLQPSLANLTRLPEPSPVFLR